MQSDIALQKCFNHRHREAAACCPECSKFFCRECVTEHDDRVICSSCLDTMATPDPRKKNRPSATLTILQISASMMTLWLIFYYFGQLLLLIPSSFHEGTLWKDIPW